MQDLYEIEKDPPGEGTGGVAPCCPARRYGGVLQAPPSGSGAEPPLDARSAWQAMNIVHLLCNLHVHILTTSAIQLSACIFCTCACKSTGTIKCRIGKMATRRMYHIRRKQLPI